MGFRFPADHPQLGFLSLLDACRELSPVLEEPATLIPGSAGHLIAAALVWDSLTGSIFLPRTQ